MVRRYRKARSSTAACPCQCQAQRRHPTSDPCHPSRQHLTPRRPRSRPRPPQTLFTLESYDFRLVPQNLFSCLRVKARLSISISQSIDKCIDKGSMVSIVLPWYRLPGYSSTNEQRIRRLTRQNSSRFSFGVLCTRDCLALCAVEF